MAARQVRASSSGKWHRRVAFSLWALVLYLLLLYAAIRWGHGSPQRYPGSD
jgi:hypothetical protein